MSQMRRLRLILALVLAITGAVGTATGAEGDASPPRESENPRGSETPADDGRPVPAIRRALIVSIDGLRPDLLLRANTPNIRRLMNDGSFTFWAKTVPQSITLPSHTSMLTGVSPDKHEVFWNDDRPEKGPPKYPTLFEIARNAGLSTAIATGKTKFGTLAKPGTLDWVSVNAAKDNEVADHAEHIIREHAPEVMFVHFPGVDSTGHDKGWGTPEQIAAIENADAQLGRLLDALEDEGLTESTVILLSADHGGMGKSHGGEDARSVHIPWIVCGPGLRKNRDLTTDPTIYVNTEDTFATICYLLNLPRGEGVDGKPIRQIVDRKREDGELLHKIE